MLESYKKRSRLFLWVNYNLKITGLEENASVCSILVCYGKELKEGFVNYGELFSSLGKVKQKQGFISHKLSVYLISSCV